MLEVHLLGPTEAVASNVAVPLSPLARNLLAILALSQGTIVSTDRIIEFLWGDDPPASPRSRVQGLVSTLRRGIGDVLVTRHPGYLLESAGCATDIRQLDDLTQRARQAATPARKAAYLRAALALWRGDPLDGVTAPGVDVDRSRLAELRVGLLEDRFEAELELGHHAELVAELRATAAEHPLRERLAGQLMRALYRSNRQADALRVYQELATRLTEELGSDPCADLRDLQLAILRGEQVHQPVPAPPPAQPAPDDELRPAQLPATVGHFTGRGDDLRRLREVVDRRGDEPRVVVVTGLGGIGKTALTVRWAHTATGDFPDGQVFLDLHGSSAGGRALTAADALGAVLTALGVDRARIPDSLDERAALYRTLTSGRRLLVVADDAATVEQVLPLMPPTAESQLVVTSRFRLGAIAVHHAACILPLAPLSPEATHDLLCRIVGRERMRDPAAATVTHWCGGSPLAIRAVGAKLAGRPGQPLDSFAEELGEYADDPVLGDDPRSVRAALATAYRSLSPAAAHLFGRLGLQSSASLCLRTATAKASGRVRRVRRLLDEMIAANLVADDGPDTYRLPDVVHRFARECGADLAVHDAVDELLPRRSPALSAVSGYGRGQRIAIESELNA